MPETQHIEIPTADGRMPAFLAEPDGAGPFPAVIVLIEAFGLVPHIESVTARLAAQGYVSIAPDVYYRDLPDNKVGYDEIDKAVALMQRVDDAKFIEDMRAVIDDLTGRTNVKPSNIGMTGFCMGGRLTFLSACELGTQIAAAAPFYGGGITNHLDQASKITAPLHFFFGQRDAHIPMEQVKQIDAKLTELDKPHRIDAYEPADHGFFCNDRDSYHPESAADAWNKLTAFFEKHLK